MTVKHQKCPAQKGSRIAIRVFLAASTAPLSWKIYGNGFCMLQNLSYATLWNACSALRTWLLASECIFLCKYDASSGNMCPFFMPQLDAHLQPSAIHWRGYGLSCHVNVASWEPDNIVKDLLLSLWWPRESGFWRSWPIDIHLPTWRQFGLPWFGVAIYTVHFVEMYGLVETLKGHKTLATSLGSWSLW